MSTLPPQMQAYIDRFNAAEVEAGCLPSPTLAQFCAHLDMVAVLNTNARLRRRAAGNPFASFEQQRETRYDRGTPETRRRKRADQVVVLLNTGRITRLQSQAAGDIRDAYSAIVRSLMPAPKYDMRVDGTPQQLTPIDRWGTREERIIRTNYGPWKTAMHRPVVVTMPDGYRVSVRNALEITMDLVWDNMGPRQIEDRHRIKHGVAARAVSQSLELYCRIAGWVEAA